MAGAAAPTFDRVEAGPQWRTVDFISDLHLQPAQAATFAAWRAYMQATPADAIFILGDLFEAWVGDDAALQPGFAHECAAVLREAAARRTLFFLHGNRDFLVGPQLASSSGFRLLSDPALLTFAGQRWVLTHGDLLCLDDTDYLRFREQVRSPQWQAEFLAQPLAQREAMARQMRDASEAKHQSTATYADVDAAAASSWLAAAPSNTMIHGHTHRPREHALGENRRRIVLSDWDATASPPRLEVLRLTAAGAERIPLAA